VYSTDAKLVEHQQRSHLCFIGARLLRLYHLHRQGNAETRGEEDQYGGQDADGHQRSLPLRRDYLGSSWSLGRNAHAHVDKCKVDNMTQ